MKTPPAAALLTDVASLARYILSKDCQSIAMLTGAGVSVASGIPDFRSPGGLYDTLRPELLTCNEYELRLLQDDPTYVVSWDIFSHNPLPYLEVRRPFILGTHQKQWKATVAHRFAELLHTKTGKLTRVYTQNIDGLDRQCDKIPDELIINVHGSISKASCEGCGSDVDYGDFCDAVSSSIKDIYNMDPKAPTHSTHIYCPSCQKALLKPSTVLYGRNLPLEFFQSVAQDLPDLNLLLIAGTSLVVAPANSLVYNVPETTPRVVINLEPVGAELGIDYSGNSRRDLFLQGTCDEVFVQLLQELGWLDDVTDDLLPEASAKLVQDAKKSRK
jgi:NAD-dependent deacetylase sirtuin 2